MNTKTKMMLGLSVLTAGTLAAGATGTFAWFTTNKTAKATYTNIVAAATQGDLKAKIVGVTDTDAASDKTDFDKEVTAKGSKSYISDVSSKNGYEFAQPDWVAESGNEKGYNSIKDVSNKKGYFTQYLVTLKNDKTAAVDGTEDTKIAVNLTGLTITVAAKDGTSTATAGDPNWIRVAFFVAEGDVSASDGFIASPSTTFKGTYTDTIVTDGSNNKYVEKSDESGNSLTLEDAGVSASSDINLSIGTLAGQATKTIGVSVWLEVTAQDNQDNMLNSTVSVALTFTSSQA